MASRRGICEREISVEDVFCPQVNVWRPHNGRYNVLAVMDKAEHEVQIAQVQAAILETAWDAWPDMKGNGGLTYSKGNAQGFGKVVTSWFQDGDNQTKPHYWNAMKRWKPNPDSFGQMRVYATAEHPPELYLLSRNLPLQMPLQRTLDDATARRHFHRCQVLKRVAIVLTANDNDHKRTISARLHGAWA